MSASAHVFIIAEAGSNWRLGTPARDRQMARTLIEVAAEAGADAIKFQTYRAETVYVPNAGASDYLSTAGITESITDIFQDLAMPYDMLPDLASYCQRCNIEFMSTPFSLADAQALEPFVKRHKIASYEISHARLIEYMAKTQKPLIMSSGGAGYEDITWALEHFHQHGGKELTLLQCTAKYPAPFSTLNLRVIPELKKHFQIPVGLSDHSRDPIIGPVGAVALGASVVEKHFTVHNKLPGPDHSFAITGEELKNMVQAIRNMEAALGCATKAVLEAELELRHYAQRSLQAIRSIAPGDELIEGVNFDILRPGKQQQGLHPKHLPELIGKKATRALALGQGIRQGDYA